MSRRAEVWTTVLVGTVPLAASAIVYAPILGSYFFADDFFNFVRIADSGCARFLVSPMAGHVGVFRNLLNCAHYSLFGLDASGYFAFVLATHLLNVGLLFRVLWLLTERRDLACLGAALWGTAPLHTEPLSWYAVYGHVLTGTVLLLVLVVLLPHARAGTRPVVWAAVGCCMLLLIGATCFGTGLAIAVATPAVILLMIPAARVRSGGLAAFLVTPPLTIGVYLGLRWFARWIGESSWSDEAVVYMALARLTPVPVMLLHLVRLGLVHLLAGAWLGGAVDPLGASWVVLVAVAVLVATVVVGADAITRRFVGGTLLLCFASYGVIALGRANISQLTKVGTSSAAGALRYHYAASAALTMCLTVVGAWVSRGRRSSAVGIAIPGVLVAYGWAHYVHPLVFDLRPYARRVVVERLAAVEAAIRLVPPGDTAYLENEPLPAGVTGIFGPTLIPGTAALVLIADGGERPLGRQVRFSEWDIAVRSAYRAPRSRWLSQMLIRPHVTLGGDGVGPTDPRCELVLGKWLLGFARGLLDCERRSLVPGFDTAACRDTAQQNGVRRTVRCRACIDLEERRKRVRTLVEVGHPWLRCAAGSDARPPSPVTAQRCGRPAIRAFEVLLDSLFECQRRSILRDGLVGAPDCEDRAADVYWRNLAALRSECGDCFGEILAPVALASTVDALRGLFCATHSQPVHP